MTEQGRSYSERLKMEFDKIEKVALSDFSEDEKAELIQLLSKLFDNMKP